MLTSRHRAVVFALGTAFLVLAQPVGAQDSATAAAMFDKGIKDMEAGRYDTACPALAESYRLDPQPGALFTLAECENKGGKLASADIHYEEYLALFGRMTPPQQKAQRGRDKTATEQRKKLAPQIPRLTLALPTHAPQGTTVKRDGVVLALVTLGTALPVDPGPHVLTTLVPGGTEHDQQITIAPGEKKQVLLEVVLPPPVSPSADAGPVETGKPPPPPPPPPTQSQTSTVQVPPPKGSNTWAYVTGGIGLVGLAAGGVTGFLAMNKKKTVDDNCKEQVCNQDGMDAVDSGRTFALVSTIGFGVGAAGVLTSVVLFMAGGGGDKASAAGKNHWRPIVASPRGNDALIGVQGTW